MPNAKKAPRLCGAFWLLAIVRTNWSYATPQPEAAQVVLFSLAQAVLVSAAGLDR